MDVGIHDMALLCLHVHPSLHAAGCVQPPHLQGDQKSNQEKNKSHKVRLFLKFRLFHPNGQEPEKGDGPGHDALLRGGNLLHMSYLRSCGKHTRGISHTYWLLGIKPILACWQNFPRSHPDQQSSDHCQQLHHLLHLW